MKIYGLDKSTIVDALTSGRVTVAVYGLGKMGLPLAAVFADKGGRVIGVDDNQKVVDEINSGGCPVLGEPGLSDMLKKNIAAERFWATSEGVAAAREADVMVVLVPCLLNRDKSPDLAAVTKVCSDISQGLCKGDFVILETTVPPRTTRDILQPILKQSGLREGDFGLAFCPERTASGRAIRDITGSYRKVVGGIDKQSTRTAEAIYSVINKKGVLAVSDSTTAETVKVFEGIYRDVNIALANELAMVCKELVVDSAEVFKVANEPLNEETGRPYTNLLQSGAGVGGHCIPVYPYFIIKTTDTDTALTKTARKKNKSMPRYMLNLIVEGLNEIEKSVEGSNVLILGLAFRDGVKEFRNSPAIPIIRGLKKLKASVYLYDPLFSSEEIKSFGVKPSDGFDSMDCLVIVTDHKEFKGYDWREIGGQMRSKVIVDGRQVVPSEKVRNLGFIYKGI